MSFADNWTLKEKLGSGSFAIVRKCINKKTGEVCAVKIIDKHNLKQESSEEAFQNEVDIMRSLNHKNIIHCRDLHSDANNHYLVMEILSGGEMFDRIVEKGYYSEKDAAETVAKILSALNYLHERGIVHRDLKPENLLYSDDTDQAEVKLADFGLAKFWNENTAMKTACGTPGYVAPEVLKKNSKKGIHEGYTAAVDVWSTGVILYILLVGYPPFSEENTAVLFQQIIEGRYEFHSPWWDNISDHAKDLVRGMMTVDPKKRLTVDQCLAHPWLTEASPKANAELISKMKEWNAKRKFKRAVDAVTVINRFREMSTH